MGYWCPDGFYYHDVCNMCKVNGKDNVELLQFVKGLEIWLLFPIIEYTVKVNHTVYVASFVRTVTGIAVFTPLLPIALFANILTGIIMLFFPIQYYTNVESICEQQSNHPGYAVLGIMTPPLVVMFILFIIRISSELCCKDYCYCNCYDDECACGCYSATEAKGLKTVTKLSSVQQKGQTSEQRVKIT